MKDLLLIVPDKNYEAVLGAALERAIALGISNLTYRTFVLSGRDGQVRTTGASIARTQRHAYRSALVIFDYEGSGAHRSAFEEEELQNARMRVEWGERGAAIVVDPEVDIWIWGSDNLLQEKLGWTEPMPIRQYLADRGFQFDNNMKPTRPKEAIQAILSKVGMPRSSSTYARIIERISFNSCRDSSFSRAREKLREWFPPEVAQ